MIAYTYNPSMREAETGSQLKVNFAYVVSSKLASSIWEPILRKGEQILLLLASASPTALYFAKFSTSSAWTWNLPGLSWDPSIWGLIASMPKGGKAPPMVWSFLNWSYLFAFNFKSSSFYSNIFVMAQIILKNHKAFYKLADVACRHAFLDLHRIFIWRSLHKADTLWQVTVPTNSHSCWITFLPHLVTWLAPSDVWVYNPCG